MARRRMSMRRTVRYYWLRIKRMPGHVDEIAGGAAIGLFFGCSPVHGTQIICAVAVAHLLKRNKVVAAMLTGITNPITIVPFMGLEYFVGRLIVGGGAPQLPVEIRTATSFEEMLAALTSVGFDVALPLVVGALAFGVVLAPLGYFFTKRSLVTYRAIRAQRRHKRYERTHPADVA